MKFYALLFVCLTFFVSITAYNFYSGGSVTSKGIFTKQVKANDNPDNRTIIKFNHSKHLKDAGAQCTDCHSKAPNSVNALESLIPKKASCANCHDVEDKKECGFCHFEGVYKKLNPTVTELHFNHQKHIKDSGMQCLDCHKNMPDYKYSSDNPKKYPEMEICAKCHNDNDATMSCEKCHTNLTNLKPMNHLKSNFLNEHKWVFEAASEKNNCMMCHSDNFCQVCHSAGKFKGSNTKKDFYAPFWTKNSGTRIDRAELQKLNTVHELNYLYTHGMDALHKSYECKTCHDPVEFCSACHQTGGNLVTGFAPKSHLAPNFKTFGVGTGGGLHAELARKDIESCQSCHDVNGGDQICIKCHFDNDGVKGTNPRTHEWGFMRDEKGIWHDTQGAICYRCHTDANARPNGIAGIGFCGYCHSKAVK